MDGGTAATATPSHSHHLESPLCHAPPSHLPPNVECRVLPPRRTAARRSQHPDIVISRQCATAPPPIVRVECGRGGLCELLQKSIVRVIRKGAPTQVIGATSFVPGKVDMVVAIGVETTFLRS